MGRGLSKLQKWILKKASTQKRLYYAEIKHEYYGWQVYRRTFGSVEPRKALPRNDDGELKHPGDQFFSKEEIGEKEYQKVNATISRSCLRLQERGLVQCLQGVVAHWAGVEITEKGKEKVNST